jgi:arsenate reductase (thioredoxin)
MDTVLFACVHNAGRSQMAAAWLNKMCDRTKARAISAGTQPGERVHPEVVKAMREEGIDLDGLKPAVFQTVALSGLTVLRTIGIKLG